MRRIISILAAFALLLSAMPAISESVDGTDNVPSLEACSPSDIQDTVSADDIITFDDEFSLTYGDVQVHLGDAPDRIVEEIQKLEDGEELEISDDRVTFYTPSYKCYETDNIAVMTDTGDNDNEEVKAVFVDIDGIKTHRGIGVGSPVEDVYENYGMDYLSFSDTILYTIKKPGKCTHYLLFQIDDITDTVYSYAILDKMPKVFESKGN